MAVGNTSVVARDGPQPAAVNRFEVLVEKLREALGPSSGLTSEDVDVTALKKVMEEYDSNPAEWERYSFKNPGQAYTRNLVDEGNGNSNLLILVWSPGKGSPIHDHGNAHCLMRILKGDLTETRYEYPKGDKEVPMTEKSRQVHKEGAVAYMADDLGVHRVSNEGSNFAVSLHLYTPPNVARKGCFIFSQPTSARHRVGKCHNYSEYGQRV